MRVRGVFFDRLQQRHGRWGAAVDHGIDRDDPVDAAAAGALRAGRRVLVVDDEPDIRELLELTLLKMGLGVTAAGTLAAAKQQLESGRFDL